jgi:FdrA protein
VVVVVGTDEDPQGSSSQVEGLSAAGARVYRNLTEAVEYISQRLRRPFTSGYLPVDLERFAQTPFSAVNVGLESFYHSLVGQGARAIHVDWRPPAGGNERLAALLAKTRSWKKTGD